MIGEFESAIKGRASHGDRNLHHFCYNQFPNFKLFIFFSSHNAIRALFYLLIEV